MKALPWIPALTSAVGLALGAASAPAQTADNPPAPAAAPATATTSGTTADNPPSASAEAKPVPDAKAEDARTATPPDAATSNPAPVLGEGESGLRLNFRGAPLEMVLNYLSEAAGFIIVLETEVKGKLDVWSNQPLNKEEAVELLNRVLNKNGYSALRDGRTLTIVSQDEAKKRDIPVRAGSDPQGIPKGQDIITQILPVKFINAVQLSRDLAPLFPTSATVAANEGGNALVITDTETNIRRIAEILKALDTGIAAISSVKVYPLKYADAKALATTVRDLFQTQDANRNNNQSQQQFRGAGGGFPGGFPGGGFPGAGGNNAGGRGGTTGTSSGSGRVAAPRVVAVADERSNSLVVSAPSEQLPIIDELVAQVDTSVDDITELRVFRLKYSDPQEMADLIANLFPDPSKSSTSQGGGAVRFGGPGGFFGAGRQGGNTASDSTRLQKQNRVTAVADLRTSSVIVTAAPNLLEQISGMITQLDSDPAKKQKVFVYSVENTDPTAVQEILQGLFETSNTRNRQNTRNTTQVGNQLNNRATQNQNQNRGSSGLGGSTGFGASTRGN